MISAYKTIISFLNKLFLSVFSFSRGLKGNRFYWVRMNIDRNNQLDFDNCNLEKVKFFISGQRNVISAKRTIISNTEITINGEDNKIIIDENVALHSAHIIFRGNGCMLNIGENTSFGGIRIINVGTYCSITIGQGCMFSDHIELWASDTHPIYDENGELINPELPVVIGNNVWVGSRVIILKGVTISDGAIVGMGSLVTKDVPPKSISVGSPNRTVKSGVSWSVFPLQGDDKLKGSE